MVLVVRLALTVIRAYRARPIAAMGTLGKDAVAVNPRVGISVPSAKWRAEVIADRASARSSASARSVLPESGPAPRDCAGRRLPLCFVTVRLQRTEGVDWDGAAYDLGVRDVLLGRQMLLTRLS